MNDDDLEVFIGKDEGCYLESLCRSRQYLSKELLAKLDEVIGLEIELALMGANRAKNKVTEKPNLRPIK